MDKKTFILFIGSFILALVVIIYFSVLNDEDLFFLNRPKKIKPETILVNTESIEPGTSTTTLATTTVTAVDTNSLINTEKTVSPEAIKIAFVGDMMFDRHIREVANNFGYQYILEEIEKYLNKLDLVVGNLEGPVSRFPSESVGTTPEEAANFLFTFSPNILPTLVNAGFQAVNIGNNHIMNFGSIGLEETRTFLESVGLHYFGDPLKDDRMSTGLLVDQIALGLVSYNEFIPRATEDTLSEIRELKKDGANLVVVYTHWGDEYEPHPNGRQIELAHQFIDSGADLVIGSHPHVIQDKEIYKGKYIYYSLGNFVFDQYFQDEVRCGAIVEIHIDPENPNSYTTKEVFTLLEKNGQTVLSDCASEVPFKQDSVL